MSIQSITIKFGDSDIELTLDEAKEIYKDLHELFSKERVVSVPTVWPYYTQPIGPIRYTTTTTPFDPVRSPRCGTDASEQSARITQPSTSQAP